MTRAARTDEPPPRAWIRRAGRCLANGPKRTLRWTLARFANGEPLRPGMIAGVRSALIVRPNFRMGNTLLATPLIAALKRQFPQAEVDFLAADGVACLLDGFPLRRVFTIARRCAWRPWELLPLLRDLRRARYDLVVDAGRGSFSGALLAFLSGARWRLGSARWPGLVNVPVGDAVGAHAHDRTAAFAAASGAQCNGVPSYHVAEAEHGEARAALRSLDLATDAGMRPFVGLFPGGHGEKRWPARSWLELLDRLEELAIPAVVFVGPDERGPGRMLGGQRGSVRTLPPQRLRLFAAICADAALFVTADSGPMHLAVSLGVPTIAILQSARSLSYGPRGVLDRALVRPQVADVINAILTHPASGRLDLQLGTSR